MHKIPIMIVHVVWIRCNFNDAIPIINPIAKGSFIIELLCFSTDAVHELHKRVECVTLLYNFRMSNQKYVSSHGLVKTENIICNKYCI